METEQLSRENVTVLPEIVIERKSLHWVADPPVTVAPARVMTMEDVVVQPLRLHVMRLKRILSSVTVTALILPVLDVPEPEKEIPELMRLQVACWKQAVLHDAESLYTNPDKGHWY